MNESERRYHEVANIFPLLQGDELQALADDIREHGQIEPIVLHPDDESIIDGRNRYRACLLAGIEPEFTYWDGNGSLVEYVVSLNLHRRHLSAIQCAGVAVEMLPFIEAEAKERQRLSGVQFGKGGTKVVANLPQPLAEEDRTEFAPAINNFDEFEGDEDDDWVQEPVSIPAPKSRDIAAKATNAAPRYVQDMKAYKENAPDVYSMAMEGKINGSQAKALSDLPEEKRKEVAERITAGEDLPANKIKTEQRREERKTRNEEMCAEPPALTSISKRFDLVYADPPWRYEFNPTDNRSIENQYPTMDLDDICNMPVSDITIDNAVLFLWATFPKLEEALRVVNSWGFKYRTGIVWDKVKMGQGIYVRQQTELLLIAIKGGMYKPEESYAGNLRSLVSIERSNVHSQKPDKFYEIIEGLYPDCTKIELFSRNQRDGWHAWGNQA